MSAPARQIATGDLPLTIGAITDGQFLKRSGTSIISAAGGGGGATYTAFTKDFGAARSSGTFDITGLSGLTEGAFVDVRQSAAAIASKGNARDEMEFDRIECSGYVVNSTTIRVYWRATGVVCGTYAFAYLVST